MGKKRREEEIIKANVAKKDNKEEKASAISIIMGLME